MSLDTLSGSGSQFPRRRVPRSIPGGLGNEIPRRRLQFSFLRRKRYSIPAQKGTPEQSGRIWRPIPAQNFIRGQSARVRRAIPAQVATFSVPGVFGGSFPRGQQKKADPKGQLLRLLFKICVITQFTCYS